MGLLPLATLGGCGEEHHHHREPPPPPVAVEPVPQEYVYYNDPYYYQGHYDTGYWYWHDREGHVHREIRDEHERRVREHPSYEPYRGGERGARVSATATSADAAKLRT